MKTNDSSVCMKILCFTLLLFSIFIFTSSCTRFHATPPDTGAAGNAAAHVPSSWPDDGGQAYCLQPGDKIDVKFFHNPELNERVTIRPDGKISLQLIGEVEAANRKPADLNQTIVKKYEAHLKKPEITVIVVGFEGQEVYVGGEVRRPGVFKLATKMTALQGILKAGGFKETAQPANIVVIRKDGKGRPVFRMLNLNQQIQGHTTDIGMPLSPFDVVFVPKTTIAKLNKFVEQYIKKMIPGNLNAGFSYTLYENLDDDDLR